MKSLIVYYSRSNTTKKVMEFLKNSIKADADEIKTSVGYGGAIGYAKGVKDSVQEKIIPIENIKHDPADYDKVIVATPVWTSKLANPVLSYLNENKGKLNNVDLVIVGKSNGFDKVRDHFIKVTGITPQNTVILLEKEIKNDNFENKLSELM